ncbi:MAG: hypothetical protein IKR19_09055 [Acholeplasmatales bacterium]|nr:hypothetical protein [Acholeplasmatales bacterium]
MANKYNCYIGNMVSQFGDDWAARVTPDAIQRSTKRIVKEIAKGSIDYEEYGQQFMEPKFIENLIIGITNELEINTMDLTACQFYYAHFPSVPNMGNHIQHLARVCYVYNVILERLNYVKITGNIGYMVDIPGLVFSDRKHIESL